MRPSHPFAFGKARRLRKRGDFLRVQGEGARVTSAHFTFLVAARPREDGAPEADAPSRLGIVASRKVGGAVQRNRIKRLCRECFRTAPDLVPPGVDLVVIPRPGAASLALEQVRAEWRSVAGLLRRRAERALANPTAVDHG